jgi:hypothetical protein
MSYGAYNGTRYNKFAWNASWSAALDFPLTASSTAAQSGDALLAAVTNAISSSLANTQEVQTLVSMVNPITGASLSASQDDQVFSGIGVVSVGAVVSYGQSSSGLGNGTVDIVVVLNVVEAYDTLLSNNNTTFNADVDFIQIDQMLNAAASVLVSSGLGITDDDAWLDSRLHTHLSPHITGKTLIAHVSNTILNQHSNNGSIVRAYVSNLLTQHSTNGHIVRH